MSQDLLDRLPPHSLDAEICLLGSMLLDREVLAECMTIVRREDFYQPDHQIIFDALKRLQSRNKPIDAVLVSAELESRGQLSSVGGIAYLGQIIGSVPAAIHGPHYAAIVREKSAWRQMISVANDVLRAAYGNDGARSSEVAMSRARDMAEIGAGSAGDGFQTFGTLAERVLEDLTNGKKRRAPTGLASVDALIGGLPQAGFSMIAARPGVGKSAAVKRLAESYARQGFPVAIISVEEDELNVAANMLSTRSGVRNAAVANNTLGGDDFARLIRAFEEMKDLPIFITDRPYKLSDVEAAVTRARLKWGAAVVIVDYLQLVDAELRTDNRNAVVTEISNRLKNAFKRNHVVGIACVQLNRGNEREDVPPPPNLHNLRDSGSLEQDGDVIIALHSEDYYLRRKPGRIPNHRIEWHVLKNKNGPVGVVPLYCDLATLEMRDLTEAERADTIPEWVDSRDPARGSGGGGE